MKFPLYNECPNCGGFTYDHSVDCGSCRCSDRINKPLWKHSDDLQEKLKTACDHDKPQIEAELKFVHEQIRDWCQCPLTQQDVRHASMIQAAVEVALQRAGVREKDNLQGQATKLPGVYYPDDDGIFRYMLSGNLFATPSHRLQGAMPADIGKPVKIVNGKYEFCEKSEAEGSLYGFSTIHEERCAVIDTGCLK